MYSLGSKLSINLIGILQTTALSETCFKAVKFELFRLLLGWRLKTQCIHDLGPWALFARHLDSDLVEVGFRFDCIT